MLARLRKAKENGEGGFTLIELLVVMIIIGILAAIAIPVFLSQRAKAQDTAAKSDVSTIGKEVATYYVDNTVVPNVAPGTGATEGRYILSYGADSTATPPVTATTIDLGKISNNVVVDASSAFVSATKWCVAVTNIEGDKAKKIEDGTGGFKYSAKGGLAQGLCLAGDTA